MITGQGENEGPLVTVTRKSLALSSKFGDGSGYGILFTWGFK